MHGLTFMKELWNVYGEISSSDQPQRRLAPAWHPLVKHDVRKCELAGLYPQKIYFSQDFEPIFNTNYGIGE